MTSSTSVSDPDPWRRFVRTFVAVAAGTLATALVAVLWIDPYDRGVFGGPVRGVAEFGSRFSDASRARDPAFDAAILGNSHIQLIDPGRLSAAGNARFVSLAIAGTGPQEQLAVLDAFLRAHGARTRALVVGIDAQWCTDDPAPGLAHPFPFWLYDPALGSVLDGLLRYSTLEHAGRTLSMWRGVGPPARPDGYFNYADDRLRGGAGAAGPIDASPDPLPPNAGRDYPALGQLASRLAGLASGVSVILVRPPVYRPRSTEPGADEAVLDAACGDAVGRLVATHAGSRLLDIRSPWPESDDPGAWFDRSHYKEPLARKIEAAIADKLRAPGQASPAPPSRR